VRRMGVGGVLSHKQRKNWGGVAERWGVQWGMKTKAIALSWE